VANFIRRMTRGTDKYKGKIPLICFDCDGVGHFANKFPHKKKKRNGEDDPKNKKIQRGKTNKQTKLRKYFAPRKTVPHQKKMKMNSMTVTHKWYYSWKWKNPMKKALKNNMKKKKSITEKNC
jgi:hypothetical protein